MADPMRTSLVRSNVTIGGQPGIDETSRWSSMSAPRRGRYRNRRHGSRSDTPSDRLVEDRVVIGDESRVVFTPSAYGWSRSMLMARNPGPALAQSGGRHASQQSCRWTQIAIFSSLKSPGSRLSPQRLHGIVRTAGPRPYSPSTCTRWRKLYGRPPYEARAMEEILKPFDTYRVHYGTTNPEGRDITRIEFFYGDIKAGRIISGKAIGPGSYVSLIDGEIELYFDSERVANALTILQGEPNLALYFVPDEKEPERNKVKKVEFATANSTTLPPIHRNRQGLPSRLVSTLVDATRSRNDVTWLRHQAWRLSQLAFRIRCLELHLAIGKPSDQEAD